VKTQGGISYEWECNMKTAFSEKEFEVEDGLD
jgi:hypothetical protein